MSEPEDLGNDDREDEAMRALLKRALSTDVVAHDAPDLLPGVQRRIRRRSRGKFFADGWSTGQAKSVYALVAIATVLLVVLAYLVLGPLSAQ